MEIYDEWNPTRHTRIPAKELIKILQHIRKQREYEITEIQDKISQYEQKKRSEEAFYRSLSPVRKFFAGRPPNHHQAVEYMVHVKDRFKKIKRIKRSIAVLNEVLQQLEDETKNEMVLPEELIKEIRRQH
ncbi:MAG TPA: hypothetical protein VFK33_09325 [Bacillales bacterium]|nr:hypothetical protein [Bacillales bacterium]